MGEAILMREISVTWVALNFAEAQVAALHRANIFCYTNSGELWRVIRHFSASGILVRR
jgi:hypothetical protein